MPELERDGRGATAATVEAQSLRRSEGAGVTAFGIRRLALAVKRIADIGIGLAGLILLAPVLLLIGIVIRLESSGPALFRQERLGKGGAPFTFYKFRTMVHDNDPAIHQRYVEQLITQGSGACKGDTGSFKIGNDPRVTRFGRILRRTSIDELPQLINMILGDMSLVGPRPPLRYEVELYSARAMRRLEVRPGITGLWQVSGRCQTTFDEMVDLDIEYVDNWSLGLDAKIILRTIPVVFGRKGAW